ncbi:hypothetical protein L6452_18900 [Arctium lappa]|uniref:Uncharacterized protein n=1 Tax=Arctium lappa TaxID=4217 RepID=A0ACB9B6Q6_ARCLA|nr:hypothetical protein L6452_18900 [Arctium lappa]
MGKSVKEVVKLANIESKCFRKYVDILTNRKNPLLLYLLHCLFPKPLKNPLTINSKGSLTAVQTLASMALCGIIHAIVGGQPLLILGVAEPTVLMYTFMFKFAKDQKDLGPPLFLAWSGWVCVWTALLLVLLSILGTCSIINRFTRVTGELFGLLIAMLFMQQAIKITPHLKSSSSFRSRENEMVSLKLQKRLAASVLKCGRGKVWLDPNEGNEISMANSRFLK